MPTLIIFHCNGTEEKKFIEYTVRTGTSPFFVLFKNIFEKNLVQTLNDFTDKCSALILYSRALLDLTWRVESKEIIQDELPKISTKNVNVLLDVSRQDVLKKNINVLDKGYTIDARKLFMNREPNENLRFWRKIAISLRNGDIDDGVQLHDGVKDVVMDICCVDKLLAKMEINKDYENVSIEEFDENVELIIVDRHENYKFTEECTYENPSSDNHEIADLNSEHRSSNITNFLCYYGAVTNLEVLAYDEIIQAINNHSDFEEANATLKFFDNTQVVEAEIHNNDEVAYVIKTQNGFDVINDVSLHEYHEILNGKAKYNVDDIAYEATYYDNDDVTNAIYVQHIHKVPAVVEIESGYEMVSDEIITLDNYVITHNYDANKHHYNKIGYNDGIRGLVKHENTAFAEEKCNNDNKAPVSYVSVKEKHTNDKCSADINKKVYLKSGCDINICVIVNKSNNFLVKSNDFVVKLNDFVVKSNDIVSTMINVSGKNNGSTLNQNKIERESFVEVQTGYYIVNNFMELKCFYEEAISANIVNIDRSLEVFDIIEFYVGSEMTNIVERHRISNVIPFGEPLFEDEASPVVEEITEQQTEQQKPANNDEPYGGLFYHKTVFAF